jgi:hypothetical protein
MKRRDSADFDIDALYTALDRERRLRDMSWQQLVRAMGHQSGKTHARHISPSTLSGMRKRRGVEADGVLQMLRWLGRTPESFAPPSNNRTFTGPATLPEVARGQVLRFDTRAIYLALDAQRISRGITWKQVAQEIGGLNPASLTGLSKGGRTWFPQVMRIFAWLGRSAASFTRASDW